MRREDKERFAILSLCFLVLALLAGLFFLLLQGCTSIEYVNARLPEYELEEIERPVIEEKTEDVVKLMRYAEKKEVQLNNFYKFYNSLRESQR